MNISIFKKDSSFQALLVVAIPLILSNLSSSMMLLADRFFLARYSLTAFNFAVLLGAIITALQIFANVIASSADVYVGQYNGSKQFGKASSSVWQMIWFSLLSMAVFIPLGIFTSLKFLGVEDNNPDAGSYFRIIICFGWLSPLTFALSSFFSGRKKTYNLLFAALTANGVNLLFNYILIFGIEGFISPLGMFGAAIATVLGQITQVIMLLCSFLSQQNDRSYSTRIYGWNGILFRKILALGCPNAIAQLAIAVSAALFYVLMEYAGSEDLTICGIIQTFLGVFLYVIHGVVRSVTSLCSNVIGERKEREVHSALISGLQLCSIFGFILFLGFFVFTETMVSFLFSSEERTSVLSYINNFHLAFLFSWLSFMFRSYRLVFSSALLSAGKTRYIMFNEVITSWVFNSIPLIVAVLYFNYGATMGFFLMMINNLLKLLAYVGIYLKIDWKTEARVIQSGDGGVL